MKRHTQSAFLAWARERGLSLDPKYPQSAVLTFVPNLQFDRFWVVPAEPERWPHFLGCMVDAFGPWSSCHCWRHLGRWPEKSDEQQIDDEVEYLIFRGIGLPTGSRDVIEFSLSERAKLIILLLATTIFGRTVGQDVYLVPDTGLGILETDHHGVIHASFKDEGAMIAHIRRMEQEGFSLPDEVPDATFKVPKWIRRKRG